MNELPLPNGPDRWSKQRIMYCGHDGTFLADVIVTPEAVTVLAPKKVTTDNLKRPADGAQWYITDMHGGYWNPRDGIFVLPRKSVTRIVA